MSYLSQEYWSAGWIDHLDESCQYALTHNNRTPNDQFYQFSRSDFAKLHRLHACAGGWWKWDDAIDIEDGPQGDSVRFVPDGETEAKPD
jgi:hypothetical protein